MIITAGSTNVTVDVYFVDDDGGTAPGEPTTGKLFSNIETGGTASYHRQGAARVDMTLITQTVAGAHADGGFIEIDGTNMPGLYRLDLPDACFSTGADYVIIHMIMASGNNSIMRPLMIDILDVDLRDSVRGGMTSLPNAAVDAAGGLATSAGGSTGIDDLATPTNITAATGIVLSGVTHTSAVIPTVSVLTNHTAQTGDNFAIVNGAAGLVAINTDVEAILDDTGTNGVALLVATQASIDAIETDTDTTIPALIADVPTVSEFNARTIVSANYFDPTADAVANVTLTATTTAVTNEVTADMTKISGSATAADNLEASAKTIVVGAVEAGTLSTTAFTTDLTEATDDHYIGRLVIFTSGVLINQASDITDYADASGTGLVTVTTMTEAPSAADTFVIV